jgi:hypothetical protein
VVICLKNYGRFDWDKEEKLTKHASKVTQNTLKQPNSVNGRSMEESFLGEHQMLEK